ncbi:hypothetical protein AB7645_02985 [Bradyrhizobium sp. 956_D2_N1_5]|uniref:hypothetical protein n=1 Tax=Bradyrhizobium sp. 956_D2_N1_5 TaxID=3240376 RepID=UPI003F255437
MRAALFAGVLLGALVTGARAQTVINVTVANDTGTTSGGSTGGAGTLSAALAQINASTPPGGFIINLQTNVTLSGPLSPIFNSVSINGNGFTISGNNSQRIFMVGVDTATQTSAGVAGSIIADRPQVAISNVILSAGLAQGGGNGAGGGMGAGGALFVNQSADVTLSNVSFANNNAKGGNATINTFRGGGGLGGSSGGSGAGGISAAAPPAPAAAFSAVPLAPAAAAIAAPVEAARTAPRASCRLLASTAPAAPDLVVAPPVVRMAAAAAVSEMRAGVAASAAQAVPARPAGRVVSAAAAAPA